MRAEIPWELIDPTPRNSRTHYTKIEELAVSIAEHGLLQNLVVVVKGERFECRAGERRRRAIGLLRLPIGEQIEKFGRVLGHFKGGVPCFVMPTDADEAANLIENIEREDLWPWEIGRRLLDYSEAGYDQEYISHRINKSPSYVSKFITFTRLSPKVTRAIEQTGDKNLVSLKNLLRIAKHYDPVLLEPLHESQVVELESVLGHSRSYTKSEHTTSERSRVYDRAKRLSRMKAPGHAKPYLRAIYEYLFSPHPVSKPDWNWK